jgi:hypothetical protein
MNANDGIDAMFKLIIECSINIRLGNKIKIKEDTVTRNSRVIGPRYSHHGLA